MGDAIDSEFGPIKKYTREEVENDGFLNKLSKTFGAKQSAKRERRKRNLNFFKSFKITGSVSSDDSSDEAQSRAETPERNTRSRARQQKREFEMQRKNKRQKVEEVIVIPSDSSEDSSDESGDAQGEDAQDEDEDQEIKIENIEVGDGEDKDVEQVEEEEDQAEEEEEDQAEEKQDMEVKEKENIKIEDRESDHTVENNDVQTTKSDNRESNVTEKGTETATKISTKSEINEKSPLHQDVDLIKSTIRQQLISSPQLSGYQSQFDELYNMLESTVVDGEGNSALLIGPRGSGKTSLINKCIERLNTKHSTDFLLIKLNSFIHPDDTSAVREIAAQLSKIYSNEHIDLDLQSRSRNVTFRNVLRILDNNPQEVDEDEPGSRMAIIFTIDDLEAFTVGNKQVLLYNLFDMTQSSKTPICIVGTSTKFTTRELLEKRVRSRFSQRLIVLNKFSNLEDFSNSCLGNLRLIPDVIERLNNKQYGEQWNQNLTQLLNQNSNLKKMILLNFHTSRNIKQFNNCALLPVSKMSPDSPFLADQYFLNYYKNQMNNHIQGIFKSLSNLELLLVISAARFIERSNLLSVNFNLAYKEYVDMIKQFNLDKTVVTSSSVTNFGILTNVKVNTKTYTAHVLRNCWISLYRLGLLIDYVPNTPERGISVTSSNRYFIIEDTKMVQLDISLKEVNELLPDSNGLKALTKL